MKKLIVLILVLLMVNVAVALVPRGKEQMISGADDLIGETNEVVEDVIDRNLGYYEKFVDELGSSDIESLQIIRDHCQELMKNANAEQLQRISAIINKIDGFAEKSVEVEVSKGKSNTVRNVSIGSGIGGILIVLAFMYKNKKGKKEKESEELAEEIDELAKKIQELRKINEEKKDLIKKICKLLEKLKNYDDSPQWVKDPTGSDIGDKLSRIYKKYDKIRTLIIKEKEIIWTKVLVIVKEELAKLSSEQTKEIIQENKQLIIDIDKDIRQFVKEERRLREDEINVLKNKGTIEKVAEVQKHGIDLLKSLSEKSVELIKKHLLKILYEQIKTCDEEIKETKKPPQEGDSDYKKEYERKIVKYKNWILAREGAAVHLKDNGIDMEYKCLKVFLAIIEKEKQADKLEEKVSNVEKYRRVAKKRVKEIEGVIKKIEIAHGIVEKLPNDADENLKKLKVLGIKEVGKHYDALVEKGIFNIKLRAHILMELLNYKRKYVEEKEKLEKDL